MHPIEFKEQNVVFGKDQKEYELLPALMFENGEVVSCWKLSWKEVIRLIFTRKIWLCGRTFNHGYPPTGMSTKKDDMFISKKE